MRLWIVTICVGWIVGPIVADLNDQLDVQEDTYVELKIGTNKANENHGDSTNLEYSPGNASGWAQSALLLKYDVSSIPSGQKVVNAKLYAHQNQRYHPKNDASTSTTMELYEAEDPWSEMTVTWASYGSAWGSSLYGTTIPSEQNPAANYTAMNVWHRWSAPASLVEGWRGGTNNGVALSRESANNGIISYFSSRERSAGGASFMRLSTVSTNAVVLDSAADAIIDEAQPTVADTTSTSLQVAAEGTGAAKRALIKFDFSGSSLTVGDAQEAELRLFLPGLDDSAGTGDIDIQGYRITADWDETTQMPTWQSHNSAHGTTADTSSLTLGASDEGYYVAMTVDATLVQGWLDGSIDNYGLMLQGTGTGAIAPLFDAKEDMVGAQLVVVPEPTTSSLILLGFACTILKRFHR